MAHTRTNKLQRDVTYSDIATSFEPHPLTGDIMRVTEEDSVKQSIKNLLLTNLGERKYQPLIGAELNAILFENPTPVTQFRLKSFVERAIENYEPRANLLNVYVQYNVNSDKYSVNILFSVVNRQQDIELPIVLQRVR